jgi:hypothetical protein
MHAWGLRLRSARGALAIDRAPRCCLPVRLTPSALLILAISELINFRDTQPACAPVQALLRPFSVALPGTFVPTLQVRPCGAPSHGSGSGWFATPFLYDSFIHYLTPVYPDAIQANRLLHPWSFARTGRMADKREGQNL